MSEEFKVPTVEELKRAYDEGELIPLISGIKVQMRSVRPEELLRSGKLPDALSQIVHKSLFKDAREELDAFVFGNSQEDAPEEAQDEVPQSLEQTIEMIKGVDAVCDAALVDPSIRPYLSLSDRMWIYKLALLPAAVLSTFRQQQDGDVEPKADGEGNVLPTERAAVHI